MATAMDFRRIALAIEGTTESPHFDRSAFKAKRIFASLAPDGLTANLRFPPEEQEFRCETQPAAYRKIPNKWGDAGWTTVTLSALTPDDLKVALDGRVALSVAREEEPAPEALVVGRRSARAATQSAGGRLCLRRIRSFAVSTATAASRQ